MIKSELIKLLNRSSNDDVRIIIMDEDGQRELAYGEYSHSENLIILVPQNNS